MIFKTQFLLFWSAVGLKFWLVDLKLVVTTTFPSLHFSWISSRERKSAVGCATSLSDSTGHFTTSSYLCCSHGLREVKSQSFTEKLYSLPLHSKKSIVLITSVTSLCGRLFPNHSNSRMLWPSQADLIPRTLQP